MAEAAQNTIYFGAFVHCLEPVKIDICEKGAIGVDTSGKIAWIERDPTDIEAVKQKHDWKDAKVVTVPGYGFFFPGFIGKFPLPFLLKFQVYYLKGME
jgi:guanine deaminase